MTTPVSQTVSNTNTKNTEDNRKVVGVDYEEDDNTEKHQEYQGQSYDFDGFVFCSR